MGCGETLEDDEPAAAHATVSSSSFTLIPFISVTEVVPDMQLVLSVMALFVLEKFSSSSSFGCVLANWLKLGTEVSLV